MKERFMSIFAQIQRPGADKLLAWLEKSDFFTAPASSRFHSSHEGGLCEHSVKVYDRLKEQNELLNAEYNDETLAVVALCHDLCKVNFYKTSMRNVKGEDGQWTQVPYYTTEEKFAFGGHGSKSVFLAMTFMPLKPDEAAAINCHMGAFDRPTTDYSLSEVYRRNKLALMLHVADMYASNFDERIG